MAETQRANPLNTPMTASYNDPVVAVDELGREIRMTRTGQRYLATDLAPARPQATAGRGLGYNILDNIIGYDDGVDTPGERAGAAIGAIASDPIGAARGAATGIGGLIERLVGGTGTMGDVVDATGLLNLGSAVGAAPRGALRSGVARSSRFDVSRRDASNIFGEGSERVRYTDPQSGGTIEVVVRPDGSASVLELEVPEASRGRGVGQELQRQVLQDFPVMGGQVSSKAAATTAYRLGRRPQGMPNATLEDVFGMIDENSSVNLVSPAAQIVETPAQRVAGLLASGRADEVTDEMMAAADPQEMARLYASGATGMDLPMDEASRMARAREMGFDVDTPLYHGTAVDFPAFDRASRGSATSALSARRATWMADNPDVASGYATFAEGGPVQRLIDASNRAEMDGDYDLADELMRQAEQLEASATEGAGGNILPLAARRDRLSFDAEGEKYDASDYVLMDKVSEAQNSGRSGVQINNFVDNADYSDWTDASHVGIFNPRDIRSRFARFDPRLSHLSNLNAANASPLLGGAVLAAPQEQPDPLRNLRGLLAR